MKAIGWCRMAVGIMVIALVFAGCSKDSDEPEQPKYANLRLSTDQAFEVEAGRSVAFTIEAGSGEYSVASKNEAVAKATLSEKTVNIQAVAVGETQIEVADIKSGQTASLKVKVLKETPPVQVEGSTALSRKVVLNTTLTLTITAGSGNYVAGVKDGKVAARVEDNRLHITGNAEGHDQVTITDTRTGKTATVAVEVWVIPDIRLSHTEIPVETGRTAVVQIIAGSGEYEIATPPNATHATATLAGAAITLTATAAAGETALEVRDTQTGKTATLTIKVVTPSTAHNMAAGEPVYMLLTTQKAAGEKINILIQAKAADEDNLWIDLNNNGTKDADEKMTINWASYTLGAQHIAIYGKATGLNCSDCFLTALDVRQNTYLTHLYCANNNRIASLEVSSNSKLVSLYIPSMKFNETQMKNLIQSLPAAGGSQREFLGWRNNGSSDENFKSDELKDLIKAKGWTPYHWVGTGWTEWQ